MNTQTLEIYPSLEAAKAEGVSDDHLVEVRGNKVALEELRINLEKVRALEAQHGKRKPE